MLLPARMLVVRRAAEVAPLRECAVEPGGVGAKEALEAAAQVEEGARLGWGEETKEERRKKKEER